MAAASPPFSIDAAREVFFSDTATSDAIAYDGSPSSEPNGRRTAEVSALHPGDVVEPHADVLPGRMFSFERYYAEDRPAYYAALRSVRERTLNMEHWLDYFLRGLAEEYERVAATVVDLSSLMPGGAAALRLSAGHERALTALRLQGRREFTRREYEDAAKVGRSTAGQDLSDLVRHGLLGTQGRGPSTRYVFSAAVAPKQRATRPGRPAKWTEAVIEAELREFLKGRARWPSPSEFRSAGQGALYAAATKAGGVARRRRIVGL